MTVTISPLCTAVAVTPQETERARAEFDRKHYLLLPGLFDPGLLQRIQRGLEQGEYYERTHKKIGVELCLKADKTTAMLEFVANDPALFRTIQQLTGCGPIGCFEGRVYRMHPSGEHYDSWHTDVDGERLIAMSVNLSTSPYSGGLLQIRHSDSDQIIHEVANVGIGDAVLFRIASHLGHRVTALEGSVPKTAYAGWFRSRPDYQCLLTERVSRRADSDLLPVGERA